MLINSPSSHLPSKDDITGDNIFMGLITRPSAYFLFVSP